MFIITIASQKGGCGKTTTSINIAAEATKRGIMTCLLDLDPQASACTWNDLRKSNETLQDLVIESIQYARLEAKLADFKKLGAELVILDLPPKAGDAILAAADWSDMALMPVVPEIFDLDAVKQGFKLISDSKKEAEVFYLINRAPLSGSEVADAHKAISLRCPDLKSVPFVISSRKPYAAAQSQGMSIFEYVNFLGAENRQKKYHVSARDEYKKFIDWIIEKAGLQGEE